LCVRPAQQNRSVTLPRTIKDASLLACLFLLLVDRVVSTTIMRRPLIKCALKYFRRISIGAIKKDYLCVEQHAVQKSAALFISFHLHHHHHHHHYNLLN